MVWSAPLPKRPRMSHDVIIFNIETGAARTMKNDIRKGKVKVLGIDLAKQSFQLHGEDKRGHTVLQKKLSGGKLVAYVANLPPCLIRHGGMR